VLLSARPGDEAAWSEAQELIGASARPGDTPEDRLVRATVLARSPDPARRQMAIGILEGLIAEGSGAVVAGAHDLLSRVQDDAGRLPEALEHAEASIAAGNNDPGAIAHLIELLIRSKSPRRPGVSSIAWPSSRARTCESSTSGRWSCRPSAGPRRPATLLEKAFAGLPAGPEGEATARGILDLLIRLDRPEVAERVARDLARRWPAGAWSLGLVLGRAGRIDEALKACQDAAAAGAGPDAALAAAQLTSSLPEGPEAKARLVRADGLLEAALKRSPGDVALLFARAVVQRGLARHDRAVEHYRALLARQPDNLAALNNLAWTLSEDLGRPKEALEPIDRAIRLSNSRRSSTPGG
jgi:tetratricopeptide (TPR) repeat protein